MTTAEDQDPLEYAPGAAGTGLSGPMATGPDAGAGPGGPAPAAGEPEHDPSLRSDPEDDVGEVDDDDLAGS